MQGFLFHQCPAIYCNKLEAVCDFQAVTAEPLLTCPSNSKRKDVGSGYSSLAEKLVEFNELKLLPFQLEWLDKGQGIEMTMVANNSQYHQSCKLKYNNAKLKRAEKSDEDFIPCKRSRSRSIEPGILKTLSCCFFCGEPSNTSGIQQHSR